MAPAAGALFEWPQGRYDEVRADSLLRDTRGQEDPRMVEYQIQPSTRRCSMTGRDLQPGERCFSVLLDEGGKLVRKDFSPEAWQGPPAGAFSFWAGRVPSPQGKSRPPIDDDLLLDCFHRLEGQAEPGKLNFRYVLALLLMRRRRFQFHEARLQGGHEVLVLRCGRTGARHEVINPGLSDDEMSAVQEDVFEALGWE
jgi:hypothetical protein